MAMSRWQELPGFKHSRELSAKTASHRGGRAALLVFDALCNCSIHWLNRKNCCVSVMGLVTVFRLLTTIAAGELEAQTADEPRLGEDCNVNSEALVGQVN